MSDALPPLLILQVLADPDVFVAGIVGALLGLSPFAAIEWLDKRRKAREARELDEATDYLMRTGFLKADELGWLPDYKARLARFNEDTQ